MIPVSLLQYYTLCHLAGITEPSLSPAPAVISNARAAQLVGSAKFNLGGHASVFKWCEFSN